MATAAVVIDEWKLPIFERHLTKAGYSYMNAGKLIANTLTLRVTTDNFEALGEVVKAAYAEAAASKQGGQNA